MPTFIGAVPVGFIGQMIDAVPFDRWNGVHVCCSGTFRPEIAIRQRYPDLYIAGNDVSLLSCAIGEHGVGRDVDFRFKGRLAFLEDQLRGCSQVQRIAGLMVASTMSEFTKSREFDRVQFEHYRENAWIYLEKATMKLERLFEGLSSNEFFSGDFRVHAAHAVQQGRGIVAFPPAYKGGYEKLYSFIDENVDWSPPPYQIWDPRDVDDWTIDLHRAGADYCVLADHLIDGLEPKVKFENNSGARTVCGYSSIGKASLVRGANKEIPFRYTAVEPAQLSKSTQISIARVESGHMTFLKNHYLARGIRHTSGRFNFLVLADGALVGGFIYDYAHNIGAQRTSSDNALYLLSDFAIIPDRRLAKLVAMLATCRLAVQRVAVETTTLFDGIETTVFTDRPVSMKYRGVFEVAERKVGKIRYRSQIREEPPHKIYRQWLNKFAREA